MPDNEILGPARNIGEQTFLQNPKRDNLDSKPAPGEETIQAYPYLLDNDSFRWDDTIEGAKKFMVNKNIQLSDNADEVINYFTDYAKSAGIDRIKNNQLQWMKQRHPIRKHIPGFSFDASSGIRNFKKAIQFLPNQRVFELGMYPGGSVFHHGYKTAIVGTGYSQEHPYEFVLPHEIMHRINGTAFSGIGGGGQGEALGRNTNTKPGHDSLWKEKHSDLEALRWLLYKEGIYDSRGNVDATEEDIQKLREKYPKIRPLLQMDNTKAAWMINNVAANNKKVNPNLVRNGGRLKRK